MVSHRFSGGTSPRCSMLCVFLANSHSAQPAFRMASRGKVMTQQELLLATTQAIEDLFKKSAHHLKFVDVNGYVER